jgi:hypothetical protein
LLVLELLGFGFGFRQFDHDAEVLDLAFRREEGIDFLAEGVGFVDQLLGLLAVVPERVLGHLGIELAEASLGGGDVKETSAGG